MQTSDRLQGKAVVVTGAASGIGLSIAQLFAEEGASVVATDLDATVLAAMTVSLKGPAEHLYSVLNVTREEDWERVLDVVQAKYGRIDVLVNNAGVAADGVIEDVTLESWRRTMSINLDGTFLGCKHAVRRMKHTGGGSIINISSVGALKASLVGPAYGASKAGVWNLSRTVALYCAKKQYGIRCNSLHPGLTRTPLMDSALPETIERLKANIPLGRLAEPIEVARSALFLASDESSYITGTAVVIDGGYTT